MTKSAKKLGKEIVIALTVKTSEELTSVLANMKNEEYTKTIQKDSLLKAYGQAMIEKYVIRKGMENLIREKLREMTKLFFELKKSYPNWNFTEVFKPEHFDAVISAVHSLTGKGVGIKIPSLALKLGHGLKKVARILIGQSLRTRDEELQKNAEDFLILMENEWTEHVSRNALHSLSDKKFNKPQDIPLTEDLVKLVTKIRTEMSTLSGQNELNQSNFRRLSELTLARIILFNKRRTGESSRVSIEDYQKAKKTQETQASNEEILASLSDLEKKLAQSLLLVEIKGKRGQKVPMLLPTDASSAIETLLMARSSGFIPATNNYLFPLPGRETYIRGWDVLAKLTQEFKCKKPKSITGTKLRKYLATTVQVNDRVYYSRAFRNFFC